MMFGLDRRLFLFIALAFLACGARAQDEEATAPGTVEPDLNAEKVGSSTDDNVVEREGEAIKIDGLSPAQLKHMREKGDKKAFQAEVSRMMKLIINSLYKNKEIFLRELISNASDALDKIRLLSLTDKEQMAATDEMTIRIKVDKDNHILHITDTGIGMTKTDLEKNLGTIAKSGTSDFFAKMQENQDSKSASDLIGQFGVGFYSAFLVADTVVVTSKHNDDDQYVWQSDSNEFNTIQDPRGNTLKRGTQISLHLKPEAYDFLELDTVRNLIRKYSQFINFPIYLWESQTEEVEEPIEEEKPAETEEDKKEDKTDEEDDAKVEEEKEEEKPKTKKVQKTTWDWVLVNSNKPIWTRPMSEITEEDYQEFYKSLTKDTKDKLAHTHFVAEGEVTFKSLLFVPPSQSSESFNSYGKVTENIKLYVRRVFITDDFQDMMPNYLAFIRGIVDSDDLPLNVSRETLQQHKLLKVIKKKLVRKVLDMIKKMDEETFEKFYAEYSTNLKLGAIEDSSNRNRLAKLLRFDSSENKEKKTSLSDYLSRMKEGQENIFYMAGASREEVVTSPFVERLLKKGFEVLYLTEAIDEYAINAIPEFEGKKFQNVAKEGLSLSEGAAAKEQLEKTEEAFKPLLKWLGEEALKDMISKAQVSERLDSSPCALVSSRFGWSANMERIVTAQTHSKSQDVQRDYYLNQKKVLEVNPRHPLIKELLKRVDAGDKSESTQNIAKMMFRTATLRSGFMLKDTVEFAASVEEMLRTTLGVPLDEPVEAEPEVEASTSESAEEKEGDSSAEDSSEDASEMEMHDEL